MYNKKKYAWLVGAVIFFIMGMITPLQPVKDFISREVVAQSISVRSPYKNIEAKIHATIPNGSKIYFISQEPTGFDYWVTKFNSRPIKINPNFSWSIGIPFYDGDIWTKSITPEEWQKDLVDNYDYVVIFNSNDYFIKNYGSLF